MQYIEATALRMRHCSDTSLTDRFSFAAQNLYRGARPCPLQRRSLCGCVREGEASAGTASRRRRCSEAVHEWVLRVPESRNPINVVAAVKQVMSQCRLDTTLRLHGPALLQCNMQQTGGDNAAGQNLLTVLLGNNLAV